MSPPFPYFDVVQYRPHPSEQHFCLSEQSSSNKHVSLLPSSSGHSSLSFGNGHEPAGLVQTRSHPSEQHFCLPEHSTSNKHVSLLSSSSGHSSLSSGNGHEPADGKEMTFLKNLTFRKVASLFLPRGSF